ncbi:MAG: hypothetical protein ACREAR_04575 [Nitrosotalea sp.]
MFTKWKLVIIGIICLIAGVVFSVLSYIAYTWPEPEWFKETAVPYKTGSAGPPPTILNYHWQQYEIPAMIFLATGVVFLIKGKLKSP